MPVEKGVINIKLAKAPLAMECNTKNSMDSIEIYHGIESFVKVHTRLLVKAFSNKPSFISCNRVIEIFFNAKTHLLLTILCYELEGTRDQVPFQMRASYTSCIA